MTAIIESRMPLAGGDLAYTKSGTSPSVLLLIHGLGGNRQTWRHLIPTLARTHTVIAPDLPGHGESDPPAGDYSLGAHACAIRDLLLALGVGQVTLIGHSLGGGVALQTAYQFPDRVGRLVLISSGGLGPEVAPILRAATLPGADLVVAGLSRVPAPVTRRLLSVVPGLASSSDASALAEVLRGLAGVRQRHAFVRTAQTVIDWRGQTVSATRQLGLLRDVPVLVAWGAKDTTIPPHHHQTFGERVPHAVLVEVAGGGHYPHETAPGQLLAAIETFLATTTPFEYSEEGWAATLTATRTQNLKAGIAGQSAVDVAIGALAELRLCSREESLSELVLAGCETELGTERIASALASVLGGSSCDETSDSVAVRDRWTHLLQARSSSEQASDAPSVSDDVVIRYGGVNALTRC